MNKTTFLVAENSPASVNDCLREQAEKSVARYQNANAEQIELSLAQLNREWDVERLIEAESAMMILLGLLIGANFGRKWLVLPLFSTAMLIVHNTEEYSPLFLSFYQRIGFRSTNEIARRTLCSQSLGGAIPTIENGAEGDKPVRAIAAAKA